MSDNTFRRNTPADVLVASAVPGANTAIALGGKLFAAASWAARAQNGLDEAEAAGARGRRWETHRKFVAEATRALSVMSDQYDAALAAVAEYDEATAELIELAVWGVEGQDQEPVETLLIAPIQAPLFGAEQLVIGA